MNCLKCQTLNDTENIFCVNCGETLKLSEAGNADLPPTLNQANILPPTQIYTPAPPNESDISPASVQTVSRPPAHINSPPSNFNPSPYIPEAQPVQRGSGKFVWLGAFVLLLVIGGGIGAFFLVKKQTQVAEILPDHLGMFVQNENKNAVAEISKQDFTNVVRAKDDLLKNESLPDVQGKPNLILYSDGSNIPLNDLKLVPLDTIKEDGSLKQINYQVVLIEGKPEMKRLRVPDGLANGKYAFALFDGFLDEGKHKFWAFRVNNAEKSDNGDAAKAMTLMMKPTPAPTPPQTIAVKPQNVSPQIEKPKSPPPSDEIAYCRTSNVVLRSAPNLSASKVAGLSGGQKVYIINYSDNYDTWRGKTANWAYVATDKGERGWVFTPLIRY